MQITNRTGMKLKILVEDSRGEEYLFIEPDEKGSLILENSHIKIYEA